MSKLFANKDPSSDDVCKNNYFFNTPTTVSVIISHGAALYRSKIKQHMRNIASDILFS